MSDKIEKLLEKAKAQTADASSDAKSSVAAAERDFADANEAEKYFARFKQKLLRVEQWNAHAALTSFALFNRAGKALGNRAAETGDFIRLTMTGSGKNDWVKIIGIDDATPDEMILTVQPTYNPIEKDDANAETVTSHFFTAESKNNFCLHRAVAKVTFHVVGLNEITNTRETSGIIEIVRNAATANLGHYLGIQKGEWTTFCKNFLEI